MSPRYSALSTTNLLHSEHNRSSDTLINSPTCDSNASNIHHPRARHGVIPVDSTFIVLLTILFSALFISSITFAFIGAKDGSYLQDTLNAVALTGSGIVLVGESVDVDVDEPSVTIRWSIAACGEAFVLPNTQNLFGSPSCGAPLMPLQIFVDGMEEAAITYNPSLLPTNPATGLRTSVQNQLQFDSDHVLNVHNAYLYPFDTYSVTSTLRAVASETDSSLPIVELPVIEITSAFSISSNDYPTTVAAGPGFSDNSNTPVPCRDIELYISRLGAARAYAMILFAISWVFTHFSCGVVALALYRGSSSRGSKEALKQLTGLLAIMLVIPQLRNAMPDAPDLDGALIDVIGFFPQMVLSGLSTICLLLILVKRELDLSKEEDQDLPVHITSQPHRRSKPSFNPPSSKNKPMRDIAELAPLPKARSSMDIGHFRRISLTAAELARAVKTSHPHVNGQHADFTDHNEPYRNAPLKHISELNQETDPFVMRPRTQGISNAGPHISIRPLRLLDRFPRPPTNVPSRPQRQGRAGDLKVIHAAKSEVLLGVPYRPIVEGDS